MKDSTKKRAISPLKVFLGANLLLILLGALLVGPLTSLWLSMIAAEFSEAIEAAPCNTGRTGPIQNAAHCLSFEGAILEYPQGTEVCICKGDADRVRVTP